MKKSVLLIAFYLYLAVSVFAQHNPNEIGKSILRNYHPREYHGYSQNWGVVQDKRGIMYFANGDGVLDYDGVNWNMYSLPEKNTVTALAIDSSGVLYVGAVGEFGRFRPDKTGKLKYESLLSHVKTLERGFTFIYEMFCRDGNIFFNSSKTLFQWQNEKLSSWPLTTENSLFYLHGKVFTWQNGKGLFVLKNNKLLRVSGLPFKDTAISSIVKYNATQDLIITKNKGFFLVDKIDYRTIDMTHQFSPFYTQLDEFLENNKVLYSRKLANNTLAILTHRGGTMIMDMNGTVVNILNKSKGVINDTHYSLREDQDEGIWLALDIGIAKAEVNAPITSWDDLLGLKGRVLDVARYNNKIYAATWQGLYSMEKSRALREDMEEYSYEISKFHPNKKIKLQCWDLELVTFNGTQQLLVASSDGLYLINGDKTEQIIKGWVTKIIPFRKFPGVYIISTQDGIRLLELKNGKFISVKKVAIGEKISAIAEDEKGCVWFDYKSNTSIGCIVFTKNQRSKHADDLFDFKLYNLTEDQQKQGGFLFAIFPFGKQALVVNKYNVSNPQLQGDRIKLSPENAIPGDFNKFFMVNSIFKDPKGNVWSQVTSRISQERKFIKLQLAKNGKYEIVTTPFKPLPQMEFNNLFVEDDGIAWICGDDGLYRYDQNIAYNYMRPYNCLIRKVYSSNRDTALFNGNYTNDSLKAIFSEQQDNPIFPFSFNSLKFDFSATSYFDERSNMYSFFLEGFDRKWSNWSSITTKEYTNLSPGTYTFKVKAKNIFGQESTMASYTFTIHAPWYFSFWGYLLYGLIFISLLYMGIKLSNRRLVETKRKLERVVRERTSELVEQQREIETEKEKSDKLLLNILPFRIAQELKMNGFAKTQFYDMATVLFADFKGFTNIAQYMDPQELIKELDKRFVFFDDVCLRHNLEKIKTIGDAYMCVGGIPIPNKTNPIDMILSAFEMHEYMKRLIEESNSEHKWELRIGMHTGKIIAGVVGKNKFAYDVWGDTVNIASRVESSGEANKINISGDTYELIKDFFNCTYRGQLPVKNRGEIDMYFVNGIHKELSIDAACISPNRLFMEKYNALTI